MKISLVWFRRNLRIADNRVLERAAAESDVVIPVYIWDEARLDGISANQLAFALECVEDLSRQLASIGAPLIVRRGIVHEEIAALVRETGATAVYADRNYEPYEIKRDHQVEVALRATNTTLTLMKDNVLFESHEVRTKEGKPYTIFTPFKKSVWDRISAEVSDTSARLGDRTHRSYPTYMSHLSPKPTGPSPKRLHRGGTPEAIARWEDFKLHGLRDYKQRRDILADDFGTSQLSPHIRFGTISVRLLAREALALADDATFTEGANTFISELLWREFYYHILTEFPHIEGGAFKKPLDGLRWSDNTTHLDAWKSGRTGVPIVDAAMRQLLEMGWMHNRARMIVASFLTKDLLINWQEGELHFMHYLTDGDQALNNGGWQWSASTGTDAQPYYRIFNPHLQSKKFDPDGEYIKRYVPELRTLPTKYIHEPHLMTPMEQAEYQCTLGLNYPLPIVDHSVQRDKAKRMFEAVKERS